MVTPVVFPLADGEPHAARLIERLPAERGAAEIRRFPDGEIYVRIDSTVAGRDVVLVTSLDHPSDKFLDLALVAATARDLGASRVGLVAPYLSFMRQDSRFRPGEGVTSVYFAGMLSRAVDWLVTVDPHLHRFASLEAVYSIPTTVARAAAAIAAWIGREVPRAIVVGPDAESEQWVGAVAGLCDAPFVVLDKTRHGDRDVSVSAPSLDEWPDRTPVLVDDIISTARTMAEATGQIRRAGGAAPVCVGIHAVFSNGAHDDLVRAGAARVVTCNTIEHPTNQICVADAIAGAVKLQL